MLSNESVYSAMRSHIALVRNRPYMQCSGQRYGLRGELAPASPRSAIVCAALGQTSSDIRQILTAKDEDEQTTLYALRFEIHLEQLALNGRVGNHCYSDQSALR